MGRRNYTHQIDEFLNANAINTPRQVQTGRAPSTPTNTSPRPVAKPTFDPTANKPMPISIGNSEPIRTNPRGVYTPIIEDPVGDSGGYNPPNQPPFNPAPSTPIIDEPVSDEPYTPIIEDPVDGDPEYKPETPVDDRVDETDAVDNPIINVVNTNPSSPSSGGMGGGGGGGGSSKPNVAKKSKSWIPLILVIGGVLLIAFKPIK